jgi:hypothetical protein
VESDPVKTTPIGGDEGMPAESGVLTSMAIESSKVWSAVSPQWLWGCSTIRQFRGRSLWRTAMWVLITGGV